MEDDTIKGKLLKKSPGLITLEKTEIILDQMKKCIGKIIFDNSDGTGFFCNIHYKDKNNKDKILPVLMTNYHVFNGNGKEINIAIHNDNIKDVKKIKIDNNRITYYSEKYDTTIIEIKKNDNISNFLEYDENLLNENSESLYKETIYIIQFPSGKLSVSYGIGQTIDNYDINHYCSTEPGSSGSPILNLENNKVFGIHKESRTKFEFNKGTFLKYPIKEFIEKINKSEKNNIIEESIKEEEKKDIKEEQGDKNENDEIYPLDNIENYIQDNIPNNHQNGILELNIENTNLKITDKFSQNNNNNLNYKYYEISKINHLFDNKYYDIYCLKWIDYSSKYGIGYILSDGNIGTFFKDGTKMIYRPNGCKLIYLDKDSNITNIFLLDNSKEMKTKIKLLLSFKAMLLDERVYEPTKRRNSQNINMKNFVYISTIIKTNKGYRFRLSNETTQMSFLDKTHIFINKNTESIIYFDENESIETYTYENVNSKGSKILREKINFCLEIMKLSKK